MLQSMVSQRVGHDLVTEQPPLFYCYVFLSSVNVYFIYFHALMLDAYIFIIAIFLQALLSLYNIFLNLL